MQRILVSLIAHRPVHRQHLAPSRYTNGWTNTLHGFGHQPMMEPTDVRHHHLSGGRCGAWGMTPITLNYTG